MQPKIHKSRISATEWGLVIGLMVCIDLMQIILDLFVVGVGVNRAIDIAVGMAFPFYLQIRGEKMGDPRRLLALLATFLGEMVPIVDAFPLWTADAVYNMFLARWRNKEADKQEKERIKIEQEQQKRLQQERIIKLDQIRQQQQAARQIEAAAQEREAQERYEEAEHAISKRSNQEEYEHLMNMGNRPQTFSQQRGAPNSDKRNPNDVALPS